MVRGGALGVRGEMNNSNALFRVSTVRILAQGLAVRQPGSYRNYSRGADAKSRAPTPVGGKQFTRPPRASLR